MLSSSFIPGGNPLEFVTTAPTRIQLPAVGSLEVYQVNAAASTLTAADSGKVIYLNSGSATTGFATTLPAPFLGARYTFVLAREQTGGTGYTVITPGPDIIRGGISSSDVNSATDSAWTAGADTVTFVVNKAKLGDQIKVESDGTNWFITGFASLFDGITLTAAIT
jgi:hypothetical protein